MGENNGTSTELERTLSVRAALAIGVGTMVGAGIFVFPGIAAGQAGPGAILSFLFGGIIALLVAVSTAELATAMPASGGGYFFISRTMGPLVGILTGVGQWIGLVFASSFYLYGFGQYAIDFLGELGFSLGEPVILIAIGSALLLTLINLIGTKSAGDLQNTIVVVLVFILSLLFIYGVLNATGIIGEKQMAEAFLPKGISPVFTTTALIFTSYLGFVQIATVGGEIKQPQKNLPRALIGSVLIVMSLYALAIFVSTSVLPAGELAELGETAMVEVARKLLGNGGALAIMLAGLLATLSSANASVLSSSRAIYALSKDNLLPPVISRVNVRFGTPHIALLMVGIPIAGFIFIGNIEVLAEVASLLHLIIYGMICVVLIVLRNRQPLWYVPTFRAPLVPYLPAVGALASFGLIIMMKPISILIGVGIIILAFSWYFLYGKGTKLPDPRPPHIAPELRYPSVLMPVAVPEPDPVPEGLLKIFNRLDLMVLGYKQIPEQANPEQSREKFEEEAQEAVDKVVQECKGYGIDVKSNLVFTPSITKTVNRYLDEQNYQTVLTLKPINSVKRLVVPIYHRDQINRRMATVLHDLAVSSHLPVTLVIMSSGEKEAETAEHQESIKALAIQQLELSGLHRKQINLQTAEVTGIAEAVSQFTEENDLVILAESSSTDRDSFFNTIHEEIEDKMECPVLVVLREKREES